MPNRVRYSRTIGSGASRSGFTGHLPKQNTKDAARPAARLVHARRRDLRRKTMGTISERGLQDGAQQKVSGAFSSKLAYDDFLHIKSVLRRLSTQDMNQLGLPPSYWRKRLQDIMQSHQWSSGQFDEIDQLLAALKE
jgi:hypothetical protein